MYIKIGTCRAGPLISPVGKADALDLPLDSKLADYFVNSVGHLTWMLNEFAYPT
jgi:hypothetical protein